MAKTPNQKIAPSFRLADLGLGRSHTHTNTYTPTKCCGGRQKASTLLQLFRKTAPPHVPDTHTPRINTGFERTPQTIQFFTINHSLKPCVLYSHNNIQFANCFAALFSSLSPAWKCKRGREGSGPLFLYPHWRISSLPSGLCKPLYTTAKRNKKASSKRNAKSKILTRQPPPFQQQQQQPPYGISTQRLLHPGG